MSNTVNSQYGEKVRKVLHKMLNSNRGSGGKITLLLLVKQPRTTEEICTKVGITEDHFRYVLSKKLVKEGLIKPLPDDSWALWDYEPLDSKQKYGASDIVYLIEILEDENIKQNTRDEAEVKIWKYCSSDSEIVGGRNDLRSFFNRTLDGVESDKGIVYKHIYYTLEKYVAFQLQGEEDIQWMKEKCYPKLLTLFKKRSIKRRNHILKALSQIYRIDELDMEQQELTTLLRKRFFFDPKEDRTLAIQCWDILLSQADDDLKETLKDEVSNLARSWDTFWSRADDELKEMLEDEVSNMTPAEKEILKKRGVKVRKKYYGF